MKSKIHRNIPLLFLIKICKWFMLFMPIVLLFYKENNLPDRHLFILHAIYSAIIFLTEIPSGYLADIWGRKLSMQLGLFLGFIGFGLYSIGHGFWGFLLAEIALGIGHGFISGSDSAILYDTLLEKKDEKKYIKYEGQIAGSGNLAEAMAGIVVSILVFSSVRYFYYMQTGLSFLAFVFSFFLIEPSVHTRLKKVSWNEIINIVRNTLIKNKRLSRYVVFSAIIGFASLSMAWFAQLFIYQAGIPHRSFGIIWTLLNGMVALGSFSSHRIDRYLGSWRSLVYILLFLSGGFFIAGQTIAPYGLVFLLIFYYVRGTAHPILKERINALTQSNIRATVLSVRSLLIRIMFAALGPLLGLFEERISLKFSLTLAGFIIIIPGAVLLIIIWRNNKTSSD